MLFVSNLHEIKDYCFFITIGAFDGVHIGHRKIIEKLICSDRENKYKKGLITFYPHPREITSPSKKPHLITTLPEKLYVLSHTLLDYVFIIPADFNMLKMSPEEFVSEVISYVKIKKIVVGENFFFGYKRAGNVNVLKELGKKYNFEVKVVKIAKKEGQIVSSTKIRELLAKGELDDARSLLGYSPFIIEKVLHGKKIGRNILGIKTANLKPQENKLLPPSGVYCGWAELLDERSEKLKAVINIGPSPTFSKGEKLVEVHILDFNQNIYGKYLKVSLVKKIREEIKFKSPSSLLDAIRKDILFARKYLRK